MSKGIRISPKYGVNPTMGICFFCGRHTNELALMGRLKDDAEAPRESVLNYQPCDACKAEWSQGVALLGVTTEPIDNRPPIQKTDKHNLYPTGSVAVMLPSAVKRLFDIEQEAGKCVLLHENIVQQLINADKQIQDGAEQVEIQVPGTGGENNEQ